MRDKKSKSIRQTILLALNSIRNNIVKIIPENSAFFRWLSIIGLKIIAKERRMIKTELNINIPVVEHCNLGCKCCSAFAPLAKETFLDVENYRLDMSKLAALTNNYIQDIQFTGGEPLLHPRICELFDIARSFFSNANISFLTNGILLLKMPDDFFENCRINRVSIGISRYPINIDINGIKDKCNIYGISVSYVGTDNVPKKKMWKYPLDVKGTQPLRRSFNICSQVNNCSILRDGKIFPCLVTAYINHFNDYFGQELRLSEGDFINIYDVIDIREIYNFFITPHPFCKYCNRKGVQFGIKYGISERVISEWT